MRHINVDSAEEYLRATGRLARDERIEVRELPGGVSNVVLYVARPDRRASDFVLKQARERLRVAEPWFCPVERNWREVDVLRAWSRMLAGNQASSLAMSSERERQPASKTDWKSVLRSPPDTGVGWQWPRIETPEVLFEDRANYLFAMTAAPTDNSPWKQRLMEGQFDARIASACGRLLGTMHAHSWNDHELERRLGDRNLFEHLRVDPYYRKSAAVNPHLAAAIQRLIDSLGMHPLCLVHGDYSPKNLLVYSDGLMLIDFEVGHYGDPAFDLGFFWSHLVLKASYHAPRHEPCLALTESFSTAYHEKLRTKVSPREFENLVARGIQNFAGCMLARLDGKSQIEYLQDNRRRAQVRAVCDMVFTTEPQTWDRVLELCRESLGSTL